VLELDARAHSAAPPEKVWELLADARTWPEWAAFDDAEVQEGAGEGEVRRFRRGRWKTRERVTAFEPARRLGYELLSGIPVRDYRSEVTLTPAAEGGTDIRWHSTFEQKLPLTGRRIQKGLQAFLAETAEGLARAAARR
jgi:uncharacterized protein YndB with AHSA1/START domain